MSDEFVVFEENDESKEDIEKNQKTDTKDVGGKVLERINKDELEPLFDPNHEHVYARDEEETDEYYAEVCTVKGCGIGRLITKD